MDALSSSGQVFRLDDEDYGVYADIPVPRDALGEYALAIERAVVQWTGTTAPLSIVAGQMSQIRQ